MRKKRSLSHSRKARKLQGAKLQSRIKLGQERSKTRRNNILKGDLDIPFWYPKDGAHIIDIVPYVAGNNDPLVQEGDPTYTFECLVHTRIGPNNDTMVLCLAEMFGKPCPICQHRQKLRDKGVDKSIWKKLFPKRRNLYNIICYDKGEEKKGIQLWDVAYFYFEKPVLAISKKPSRSGGEEKLVNFADPENGRSITFTIEPAQSKEDYPQYVGHSFDERDYEISEKVLKSAVILDEAVKISSFDEISEIYWSKDSNKKEETSSKKKDSEEEEIDDLLDELEDLEEMDELEDFIEDHDLDVSIKKRDDEDQVKDKIADALEENRESGEDD